MNTRGSGAGYTIVETMIVLAVSSALLVSAMLLFRGQTGRSEFSQAVREFELRLQDVVNDVATGYYPNTGDIGCATKNASNKGEGIRFVGVAEAQGKNADCIFIGKAILFGPQDTGVENLEKHGFRIYTIAGQRVINNDGKLVKDLQESKPLLLARGTISENSYADMPNAFENALVGTIADIKNVYYTNGGGPVVSYGIGVVSTFGKQTDQGFLISGSSNSNLVSFDPVMPAPPNQRKHDFFVNELDTKLATIPPTPINDEVVICLSSNGLNPTLYGRVTLGGSSRQLKTSSIITTEDCSSP